MKAAIRTFWLKIYKISTQKMYHTPNHSQHISNGSFVGLVFLSTGRTYSYLFSEPSRNPVFPTWMGADHAEDLQFVFGKPFSTPLGYFPRHRDISGYMIAYWTNFARTG